MVLKWPGLVRVAVGVCLTLSTLAGAPSAARARADDGRVTPKARAATESDKRADLYIIAVGWPDLSPALARDGKLAKTRFVVDTLRRHADRAQAGLRQGLTERGVVFQVVWLDNALRAADVGAGVLAWLASRDDVALVDVDSQRDAPAAPPWVTGPQVRSPDVWLSDAAPGFARRLSESPLPGPGIAWGVVATGAPSLWARGIRGQGVVIADLDTGARWDHAALARQYRGSTGGWVSHSGNWFDPVAFADAPVDVSGHGTHTTGTLVGDDGDGNQIGVAPGAAWIACRNMAGPSGVGAVSLYVSCFQFALAPTDLAGNNPNPEMAADITSNSWACDPGFGEAGCDRDDALIRSVEALRLAGILVVSSAGNSGLNGCDTVKLAPGMLNAGLAVGAVDPAGAVARFSSRGPGTASGPTKPDLVAPGSDIPSAAFANRNAYRNSSGTSMAAPHVAGVAALVWSAAPWLKGEVLETEAILRATARPIASAEACGGVPGTARPNNTSGFGQIDAVAAVAEANALTYRISEPNATSGLTLENLTVVARQSVRLVITTRENGVRMTKTIGTIGPNEIARVSLSEAGPDPGAFSLELRYDGLAGERRVPVQP